MNLPDLAARIDAHLKRLFGTYAYGLQSMDPGIVRIAYTEEDWGRGEYRLPDRDAARYLEWLDAGNVGRHWEALRETEEEART